MQDTYVISAEEKSIAKLAYMDTLTGLYNRRGLEKYINDISVDEKKYELTVCSFDLNKLKKVNDTYGHSAGDELIKSFAIELNNSINLENEFVGRMGGDEFIALINTKRADAVLKDIKQNIQKKNNSGEFKHKIYYSVGPAKYISNNEQDIQDCIRMADYAMYEMKSSYRKK